MKKSKKQKRDESDCADTETSEKELKPLQSAAKKAKKALPPNALTINYTGVRSGEILLGVNPNQTLGVEMQIRSKRLYHPLAKPEERIIRDRFNKLAFFSEMNYEARVNWLNENIRSYGPRSKENHLCDPVNETIEVKFLRLECAHWNTRLDRVQVETLLHGNPEDEDGYWPIAVVYEMLRPKDKVTKATHHNLIFRPENWEIKPKRDPVEFSGAVIVQLDEKRVYINYSNKHKVLLAPERALWFETANSREGVAILFRRPDHELTEEDLKPLVQAALANRDEAAQYDAISELLQEFTPTVYKSLLQKIVRTRAGTVTHAGQSYSAKCFLLVALAKLAIHTGSFSPNTQRFITGFESAAKRLAVIILEDSWVEKKRCITLLLADALVKKQDRLWMPPIGHFEVFFRAALEALQSVQYLKYKTDTDFGLDSMAETRKSKGKLGHVLNYVLLKEIGSMSGDIAFYSHIAKSGPAVRSLDEPLPDQRYAMPLIHCIDQHCFTGLAHYMPYFTRADLAQNPDATRYSESLDRKRDKSGDSSKPFESLFSRVWRKVSSMNGRKNIERMLGDWEQETFVQNVRFAQQCVFEQKFGQKKPIARAQREEIAMDVEDGELMILDRPETQRFVYKIDASWLAGLIGPIEVSFLDNSQALVVLRVDNIHEMLVVRKPGGRKPPGKVGGGNQTISSSGDLTAQQKVIAIEAAKGLLRNGYKLKHIPDTLAREFSGAVVWLEKKDTQYVLEFPETGRRIRWEEGPKVVSTLESYVPDCGDLLEKFGGDHRIWCALALRQTGRGRVARNADALFEHVMSAFSMTVLKRLYMYISNYRPEIKLYDISRDGSSSKLDVAYEDVAVYHILCAICVLYPDALELGRTSFEVTNGPLFWFVRSLLKQRIDGNDARADLVLIDKGWKPISGDSATEMMVHQQNSLDEMVAKREKNKRGHAIFIDVGLGKTMITMAYMAWLVDHDKMPTYCVYTAPPAAIINAEKEFTRFGIPHRRMIVRSGNKQEECDLQKYQVNILEHDQMRRPGIYSQLKRHACHMLFIVDEFHLTTACNTIRSSIALEISRLSEDFIAMTGTLIRNESVAELIPWLEQIVDFYVNQYNYMVAFGALIAHQANTGVEARATKHEAEFSEAEREAYYERVPEKLGGTAQKCQFREAVALCYKAVTREIVNLVCHYVEEKQEIVFVLARDIAHQNELKDAIVARSRNIGESEVFLIGKGKSITLKPRDQTHLKVIITILKHTLGYTLTKCRVSITGVYPSNQATRTQFEGRTNRLGQPSPYVDIITVHCGLLSYMLEHYAKASSFAAAIKAFATYTGQDCSALNDAM